MTADAAPPLRLALDLPLRAGDAAFTFAAGPAADAAAGTGVVVPFGRRLMPGVVLGPAEPRPGLRAVLAVVTPAPLVPPGVVRLAEWTAQAFVSSVGEALAVAVPWEELWHGLVLRWDGPPPGGPASLDRLSRAARRKPVSLRRASRLARDLVTPEAGEAVGRLVGVLPVRAQPGVQPSLSSAVTGAEPGAAADRKAPALRTAVRDALAGGPRVIVVAGWPRQAAYLTAIRLARQAGWPSIVSFASVDGALAFARTAVAARLDPVLLHGSLSGGDRLAAWRSVSGRRDTLVVGTRAAVFAPVADPVLIVVDEEDASGHKEDRAPRFVTGAVAQARTRAQGVVLLGAATPPVATYAATQTGQAHLVALPSARPHAAPVDLRGRPDRDAVVSRPVVEAVRRAVRSGGRAVLLVERKGYAGGLHCSECGSVERCSQCGVAMAFDRARRRLVCRVCGRVQPAPSVCCRCGTPALRPLGAGTERVAAALRHLVPRVWRIDSDVVHRGQSAAAITASYRLRGGALVATTIVLPHLPDLAPDVVAVVAADRWLHRPEFRAAERMLALLRLIGLSTGCRVLVETADPHHAIFQAMEAPSLRSFYAEELALRRTLRYPPYATLARVTIEARSPAASVAAVEGLRMSAPPAVEVLGPLGAEVATASTVMRDIVVRSAERDAMTAWLASLPSARSGSRGSRITVDVDPHEL